MVDKDKQSNVFKLVQPRQEAKFTKSYIDKFTPTKAGNTYATNFPYLCIRTQKTNSKFYTIKRNTKLSKGAVNVLIGDIQSITLAEAVKQNQNNVALIGSGVNPNHVELGIQKDKEPTIYEQIQSRLDRLKRVGGMSPSALVLNTGLLKNHLIHLGRASTFTSLTEKQLETFYLSLTPSVARQCVSLLSATFEKLSPKQKRDNENPRKVIARLELSKKQRTKKDIYLKFGNQRGDIGRFFEALTIAEHGFIPDENPDGTPMVVLPSITKSRTNIDILMFYLLTSVRKENVASLKWTEVDWKAETITFLVPKGQAKEEEPEAQILPISPYLRAILEFRKKNSPKSPFVFPSIMNPEKPFDLGTIDSFCNRLALMMCCYGQWHKEENNPINPYLKKGDLPLSPFFWRDMSKLIKTNRGEELNLSLNRFGTKPHGLRRTIGNIAEAIGVGQRTISTLLNRSANDVDSQHYIEVQSDNYSQGLDACHKAIDNRIAEYLSLGCKKEENKEYFESPILEFYGLKNQGIEKDKAYRDCGHGFTDLNAKNKEYQYGDIKL